MLQDTKISPELLAAFAEPGFEPVTFTIADLVTIRMDAQYEVIEVKLQGKHSAQAPDQLEIALKEAFNHALRRVSERNADRLSELMARARENEPAASES